MVKGPKKKRRAGEKEREDKTANVRFDGSMHLAFVSTTFRVYYPLADQHLISSSVDSIAAVLDMLCFSEKKSNNFIHDSLATCWPKSFLKLLFS